MFAKYESEFTQQVTVAIENARLDCGMSVNDLIDKSGIRRSSYFRKMRGDTTFDTEDIDAIARALGIDAIDLLLKASKAAKKSHLTVVGGSVDDLETATDTEVEEARQLGVAANKRESKIAEQEGE